VWWGYPSPGVHAEAAGSTTCSQASSVALVSDSECARLAARLELLRVDVVALPVTNLAFLCAEEWCSMP